jgi:hypothetical protein
MSNMPSPQRYKPQRTTSVAYCSSFKPSIWVLRIMNVIPYRVHLIGTHPICITSSTPFPNRESRRSLSDNDTYPHSIISLLPFILHKYTSKLPQLVNFRLYHHATQLRRHRHHSLQTRLLGYAVAKPEGLFPTNSLSPTAPIWKDAMLGTPFFLGKDGWRGTNRY